jgi:hypothetical protein
MRQIIIGGLAVELDRLTDLVQVSISAQGCELCGPIATRIRPEGFIVMP